MKSEITIKTVRCKGCGICVKVCPFDAIDFVKEEK